MKNALTLSAGLLAGLLTMGNGMAQTSQMEGNMVGKTSKTEFEQINKDGAAKVASITPSSAKLSASDESLMMEVAMGGMTQLETSKIALQKATNPEVRALAQAEVEEQTGLSDKLKAIASAKGVTLPTTPDAKTQAMLTRMEGMSGTELDRHYVQEHGVKGHEKLDKVMTKVKSKGKDSNLLEVAQAAHPLVKTHLTVARQISAKLRTGATTSSSR